MIKIKKEFREEEKIKHKLSAIFKDTSTVTHMRQNIQEWTSKICGRQP